MIQFSSERRRSFKFVTSSSNSPFPVLSEVSRMCRKKLDTFFSAQEFQMKSFFFFKLKVLLRISFMNKFVFFAKRKKLLRWKTFQVDKVFVSIFAMKGKIDLHNFSWVKSSVEWNFIVNKNCSFLIKKKRRKQRKRKRKKVQQCRNLKNRRRRRHRPDISLQFPEKPDL